MTRDHLDGAKAGRAGKVSWRPSYWGRQATKCGDWSLTLSDDDLTLEEESAAFTSSVGDIRDVNVISGFLWATIELGHPARRLRLRGISNRRARRLVKGLTSAQADLTRRIEVQGLIAGYEAAAARVLNWVNELSLAAAEQLKTRGWLTREFTEKWAARKADLDFDRVLQIPELQPHLAAHGDSATAIHMWRYDLTDYIAQQNEHHMSVQLETNREFFKTVEKSPLTSEQTRAVVCFDNRMLVVASAGSGKTSTMVAKAGYALRRGLVPADRILMLAFNADAAKELQQRTRERLRPLGLNADAVAAKTFHAFGLEIIGQVTGKKPSLAPWLDGGKDTAQLGRIVDVLRSTDPVFRNDWDYFRAVLARDYDDVEVQRDEKPNGGKVRTARGEMVRSTAERLIANWLYFNGVDYVYERPYEIDTRTSEHAQYHPDFYYPKIDAYHEHWATDENGQAPKEFGDYLGGMEWKRQTHRQHGTTLLETTMAELWRGDALDSLAKELTERGIRLRPTPDRLLAGQAPTEYGRLLQTFRSFLTHAKSNRLSDEQLQERLEEQAHGEVRFRDQAFLRLFVPIRREWERMLSDGGYVDYEDMLNLSADHLEAGDWESSYELVMVDEFQDVSNARARLAKALVDRPGRHLFAVGDDWQSINRFAGADLSVMTNFEGWFGSSVLLRLERTFRFPQSLADVSSHFVLRNPGQIAKTVVSSTAEFPPTIGVVSVDSETAVKPAIRHRLKVLHDQLATGVIPAVAGRKLTVFVLGRYRHQSDYLPDARDFADLLEVKFMTMHSSKGAEADYVIIPGMTRGKWGFPSTIPTDPALRMAMPAPEEFPRAEERRLFYVAMTRARRGVLLVTVEKRESPFLMELIRDQGIVRTNAIGEVLESAVCPNCGRAFMVERVSKRGPFLGCQRYPRCKSTMPF